MHRLRHFIENLLSNAVKYTQPGGSISIVMKGNSPWLSFVVTDKGNATPHAVQGRIFARFDQGIRGSRDGLGIGPTLVKNLAELHGGSVEVKSEGEGNGSAFPLSLPVVCPPVLSAAGPPGGKEGNPRETGIRVLIADDGRSVADILGMYFEMEGTETAVVYDGLAAVRKAAVFSPHLVVLDIGMPEMDGYEAARRIREIVPDAIIVALSGWGADKDRKRSSDAGFDMHLVKPPTPADLRALLTKYFPGA